jgi:hypothetical protein
LACCAGELVGQARARGRGRRWTESQARGVVRRVGLKEEEGREEKEGKRKKEKREKRKKGNKERKIEKGFRKLGEILGKNRREVKKDFCGFFWVSQTPALIPGRR